MIGKDFQVWLGFCDSFGEPLLGATEVFSVYKGYTDRPQLEFDFEKSLAVLEGTSPMSDLDAVNAIYVSKDGMDQYDENDTSFDAIYEDAETTVKWGKV